MHKVKLFLFAALIISGSGFSSNLMSQNIDQVQTEIKAALSSLADGRYALVGAIIDIDSASLEKWDYFDQISNPYHTLTGCFLFTTRVRNDSVGRFAIGVFKSNTILWMSDTLMGDYSSGNISAVFDINRDGNVDIVTYWEHATDPDDYDMWIFSWDGVRGWAINDAAADGGSEINTYCHLSDIDGDGIYELVGEISHFDDQGNETSRENVIYKWNGTKYFFLQNPNGLLNNKFAVANNLTATVSFSMSKIGGLFNYWYGVTNSSSSVQDIKLFGIKDTVVSAIGIVPFDWVFAHRTSPSISIFSDSGISSVRVGGEQDSFIVRTSGLPVISHYYAQAFLTMIEPKLSDTATLQEDVFNNIFSNSYVGTTVGPADPPYPTSPLAFVDSLIGYTNQSRSLGWIKDQATGNKYLGYFSSALTHLQSNDIGGARSILQSILISANSDSASNLTNEAYALIEYNTQYLLAQLPQSSSGLNVKLINSLGTKLTGGSLQYYEGSWKPAVNNNDGTFTVNTTLKTMSLQMTYAYGVQTKSNVFVGSDTVVFQTVSAQVKLQNSQGSLMDTGTVQYYAGAWRNLGTTVNGVATMELLPISYSFRMNYAFASNDKAQDLSVNPIVVFQTTSTSVQLKNSQGNLMDTGTVQYYSGAWRAFGTTTNGVTTKELLPNNYSFSMTYAFASNNKQQDIGANSTVVFQTVNAAVQLKNSQGSLIDQGTVQYYSGAWRTFGTTSGGVTSKELLPNSYSFSMTYAYASNNKQQDIGANSTVVFQTVNAAVQLKNSQGSLMDTGTVQYYSGAWRTFGSTSGGVTTKELLPNNYSFMLTYAYASNTKQQDLNSNPTVVFQTVNATVQLKNSQGNLMDTGTVQYYSGAWRTFGTTKNGAVSLELLPNSYQFSLTYANVSNNKTQDVGSNNTVSFSTVLATVNVINTLNNPVNNAVVTYYSGAWRQFGNTVNGNATKELLPANLQFRAQSGSVLQNKTQDLSTNPVGVITLNVGQ